MQDVTDLALMMAIAFFFDPLDRLSSHLQITSLGLSSSIELTDLELLLKKLLKAMKQL